MIKLFEVEHPLKSGKIKKVLVDTEAQLTLGCTYLYEQFRGDPAIIWNELGLRKPLVNNDCYLVLIFFK